MSVENFMHYFIPFSVIFVIPCRVPKILVELSVCKQKKLSIKVRDKVQDIQEDNKFE
jgi:hypothetical protein